MSDYLRLAFGELVMAALCLAAAPAGEVQGVVLDPAGATVAGARIVLTTAGQLSAGSIESGDGGRFRISGLAPGNYIVTAGKAGFAQFRTAVEVTGTSGGKEIAIRLDLSPVMTAVSTTAETSHAGMSDSIAQPATIISQQDLYERALMLSDAADGVAGVHQLRTSPTLGAYFVRGLTGKNVAVFRDGVRYTTSAQRGGISTFLNLTEPEGLDSVEVLRGPNSAQYGSDSLGGTVAIVSKAAELSSGGNSWHGQLTPLFQSAATGFGSGGGLAYSSPRFAFQSNLTARRMNTLRTGGGIDSHAAVTRFLGLPSTVLGDRLPDTAYTSYGGSFHAQTRLGSSSQLVGHYERSQQDGGKRYDQLLGGDGNWIADLRNLMLDFGYLRCQSLAAGPFDRFSLTGSYNAQREERVNQGGQGNPAGAITHQYERTSAWGLQFLLEKRLRNIDWLFGGEGYFERINAPSFTFNPANGAIALVRPRVPDGAHYLTHGLYTQAGWQPLGNGRLRVSGALRFGGASYNSRASRSPVVGGRPLWPDDSLSANAFSGRAGVIGWVTQRVGLHANYSRGFRVPNVTDLGTLGLQGNGAYEAAVADLAGRNATIGDRADDQAKSTGLAAERLRPEVTNNIDFGIRARGQKVEADFTAFFMNLENSILSQTLILPAGAVGQPLGAQAITRQLATGAVFVPASTSPVLLRANFPGARIRGVEHSLRVKLTRSWSFSENITYVYAEDSRTGLSPDIEPAIPPLTFNPVLRFHPAARRFWFEAYATVAGRQDRLSSLALSDRRIGNPRSRANIQSFFNNGARTRGLVANGILIPTGETLAQVQDRVLGTLASAPQFNAIPGFGVAGLRGGLTLGERTDLLADFSNIGDKNYRGIGWGVDGPGRGVTLRLRYRF